MTRISPMEHGHEAPLQTNVSWDGVVATVIVNGELDITSAAPLDGAGVRVLDAVHTLLQTECPVIVRQPRPSARKVFGITGLMEN